MTSSPLPPLSVLAAWQRRGSAILDDLTEAAAWDALASHAATPSQAAACIAKADEIVLGNIAVLHAVLDEENRLALDTIDRGHVRPPLNLDRIARSASRDAPVGHRPLRAMAGSWDGLR